MSKLPCANTMIFKKYPPLKSGPPEISVIQREFRTNEGDDDFATHPPITVDRIVMDVCPKAGNGNTGLPTGAPAVIDNVLQTIDFAYVGVISELYKNGLSYFSGIISNVKYYLGGVLIHSWDIAVEALAEIDLIAGTLLTFVNSAPSNWGLFDKQADGDWLGQELWTFGDAISNGAEGGFGTFDVTGVLFPLYQSDLTIEWSFDVTGMTEGSAYLWGLSPLIVSNGNYYGTGVPSSPGIRGRVGSSQCNAGTTFSNISIKEVLKNA